MEYYPFFKFQVLDKTLYIFDVDKYLYIYFINMNN